MQVLFADSLKVLYLCYYFIETLTVAIGLRPQKATFNKTDILWIL
jgi:hypothetical protein